MAEYRNRENASIINETEFRDMFPDTAFPAVLDADTLAAQGYDPVMATPSPETTIYEIAVRDGAEQDSLGNWMYKWVIQTLPENIVNNKITEDRNNKWIAIKAERDRREAGGVKVGQYWFHSDELSAIKILALVIAGPTNIPVGLMWKTMGGIFVPMSHSLAMQVYIAEMASSQNLFAIAEQKKAAMLALDDPTTYDTSTGWPDIFEG